MIKYYNTLTPFGLNMNLPIEEVQLPELSQATEVKVEDQICAINTLVPYKRRKFDSRNYPYKIQLLNKLMLEDKFNCNTLDKYKVNNLQKLFDHLENINAERLKIPKHTAQTTVINKL